jgi:hypothetical protein
VARGSTSHYAPAVPFRRRGTFWCDIAFPQRQGNAPSPPPAMKTIYRFVINAIALGLMLRRFKLRELRELVRVMAARSRLEKNPPYRDGAGPNGVRWFRA